MKILITGVAGFIGFHLCNKLLSNAQCEIVGIDNLNDYYEVSLKEDRLKELGKSENSGNFTFIKGSISDADFLNQLFSDHKFDLVINLAAQAGVRYSFENPLSYIESNLVGFYNILESCAQNNVNKLIYASSSSVYGDNEEVPFSEYDITDSPSNLYAATKKSNELLAYSYSKNHQISAIGLRFFTVYGPWGRPDMALYKFTKKIYDGESIDIYNDGDMYRDFTYIDDIIDGVEGAIDRIQSESYCENEIYNLGNSKPEKLSDLVRLIELGIGKEAEKNYLPMQKGEMYKTYADIQKARGILGFEPRTSLGSGSVKFLNWFKAYYNKGL